MSGGVVLQAIVAGLSIGAVFGLVGLGFTLVWSLTRVLAFAHGDIVVGGVLLAVLAVIGTTPVALSPDVLHSIALVVLTLLFGVALSTLSYVVAVRPFLGRGRRPDDLLGWVAGGVTTGLVIRTALAVALPAAAYAVPDPLHLDDIGGGGVVHLPGGGVVATRVFPVLAIALLVALVVDRLLVGSTLGRAMRSVAEDPDAATLCGVAIERVVLIAFAIAGLLAAVAALLVGPAGPLSVDRGGVLGLDGAAAALLGRLGSSRQAVAGGLVIGVAQQLVAVSPHLGAAWSELLPLAVLLAVLAARPGGLLAPREVFAE
ncbi:MAG TPA: branched-chain amino acid ABC transporter permease [Mycobacteriales bacterium]|nr:branched-chain amino acid ABC transporter permease [Mycobacteriales bacterium]